LFFNKRKGGEMQTEINKRFGLEVNIDDKNRIIIPSLIRERTRLIPQQRIFIQKISFGKILISVNEPEEYISAVMDEEFRVVLPKRSGLGEFFKSGKVRFLEVKGGKSFIIHVDYEKKK